MAEKHQHREPIGSNHGQNLFVNRFLQADGKFGNIFHPWKEKFSSITFISYSSKWLVCNVTPSKIIIEN